MQEVWSKFSSAKTKLGSVESDVAAVGPRVKGKLATLPQQLADEWGRIGNTLEQTQVRLFVEIDGVVADVQSERQMAAALLRQKPNAAIEAGLRAVETSVTSSTGALRSQIELTFDGLRAQIKSKVDLQKATATALGPPIDAATAEMTTTLHSLRTTVEAREKEVEEKVDAMAKSLGAQAEALEKQAKAAFAGVNKSVDGARATIKAEADAQKSAVLALFDPVEHTLRVIEDAVTGPIKEMKAHLDAVEKQLKAMVAQIEEQLDTIQAQGMAQIKRLLAAYQEIINAAMATLSAIRALVSGIRPQVMPPIDALYTKLNDLQTLFRTGIDTLNGLLQKVILVLDMIPAKGLPKAVVTPTISSIQDAIKKALPQIRTAATMAREQLGNMAQQIQSAVLTAREVAVTQINTVERTLNAQIDAVLPPVIAQLLAVRDQIDALITQINQQIHKIKTGAVSGIKEAKEKASKAATALAEELNSKLNIAEDTVNQGVQAIRDKLASARKLLETMADKPAAAFSSVIVATNDTLNRGADEIEKRVADFERQVAKEVETLLAPITKRLDEIRTALAELEAGLDKKIAALRTKNTEAVKQVVAELPTGAAQQQQIDAIRMKAKQELFAFRSNINQLMS